MLEHLITSLHLNIWKVKIWLSQERKKLLKRNKKRFSLFHNCSPLHPQNTLAKMSRTQPLKLKKKNNFMAPFYGRGSTASRLEPLRGGSLFFTTKFPEISDTHFTDLGTTQWFWTRDPWTGNPAPWPLGH